MRSFFKLFFLAISLICCAGVVPAQEPIPVDTLITLQRSTCLGTCPDYTLTISGKGNVTFNGRFYVKVTEAKAKLDPKKVRALIAAFETASFFSLQDQYRTSKDGCPEVWTDNPMVNTSIRINGRSKAISHYHGCQSGDGSFIYPKALTELEDQIDHIVGTKKWLK